MHIKQTSFPRTILPQVGPINSLSMLPSLCGTVGSYLLLLLTSSKPSLVSRKMVLLSGFVSSLSSPSFSWPLPLLAMSNTRSTREMSRVPLWSALVFWLFSPINMTLGSTGLLWWLPSLPSFTLLVLMYLSLSDVTPVLKMPLFLVKQKKSEAYLHVYSSPLFFSPFNE